MEIKKSMSERVKDKEFVERRAGGKMGRECTGMVLADEEEGGLALVVEEVARETR